MNVYFGNADGTHYETTTDASGSFRIFGMIRGEYGSHFEKDGFVRTIQVPILWQNQCARASDRTYPGSGFSSRPSQRFAEKCSTPTEIPCRERA